MKRRQRRQVLDINGEQSDSPRRRWQNKYEQIAADHNEENGGPSNPLANLVEQYNSDSETDDSKSGKKKLDDKVNDFLKEIQMIAPEPPAAEIATKGIANFKEPESAARVPPTGPSMLWQECIDDSTGYPYYWHVETNEVTWEVPEEIRLLRDANQQDSLNRTSYSTQWVNFASNTYPQPQINIPEGMIPKEVVARNRNRQVSSQQNIQPETNAEPNTSRNSVTKEDESDDGKIEMITSFGSDGSESETSDNDSPMKKLSNETQPPKIQRKTKTVNPCGKKLSSSSSKKTENSETSTNIGPSLPSGIVPLIHGPENSSVSEFDPQKWQRKNDEKASPKSTEKSETSTFRSRSNSSDNSSSVGSKTNQSKTKSGRKTDVPGKELKFSLVPGYADDSDVEEETSPKKVSEPLFPIAEFSSVPTTVASPVTTLKKVETRYTETGSVRIFQYQQSTPDNAEQSADEIKQMNDELESDVQENFNVDDTRIPRVEDEQPKPNIFLENLETPTKAFQRKRRIAFDVIPSKNRPTEVENVVISKPEPASSPPATLSGTENDRHGLGFPKDPRSAENKDSADAADRKTNSPTTEKPANVTKTPISFVKGETMVAKADEVVKDKTEEELKQLRQIPETITEKLKFLSEGGQPASAVQVMAIQLQTLLAAWEAGDLKDSYMENWLNGVSRELGRLEEAAAPPGWSCQWDRSHKRYFYRNSTTGEAQWTYPEADVIGGTEEMELCTTPPPQGQEEPCIIESQTDKSQDSPVTEKEITVEETSMEKEKKMVQTEQISTPPPPNISSPSPPPPPRIYAEDMKKGKKRRGSTQTKDPETKKDKISQDGGTNEVSEESVNPPLPPSPTKTAQPPLPPHPPMVPNPPNSEPLPPGVDPPDMPFALTAPSIETTMLYTATGPQTNPIYAATIGDPTLIGHHTALMQGQLMHYPTYHQHLHNQAIIAAANRLNGQEAVQFMVDYSQVYANTQVIAKPPTKSQKESLGSALDSFYSDIASIENTRTENDAETSLPAEPIPVAIPQIPQEPEPPAILTDSVLKERKKKKAKLGISKKQKEVSSMVAKWQKAQHYEDND